MTEAATDSPRWGMQGGGRTARVYTNETCNQGCGFCDRRAPRERRDFVAPAAVRARIDAAAKGSAVVVLTGGEPTMRRDLVDMVRHAVRPGVRVELETNAALIDGELARALAGAGLDCARVHLPGWGEAADHVTRDPGGFDAARVGIEHLIAAGIAIEIATPVVAENEQSLPRLPAALAETGWPLRGIVIGVPTRGPDAASILPFARAAKVVGAMETEARRHGLKVRLDPHSSIPPCAFDAPARVAHLFALTPGGRERAGFAHRDGCAGCTVADRCPGVPDGAFFEPLPIREDRVRRRLSLISTVDEQIERELYQDEVIRPVGHPARRVRTIRIAFRCNQACSFCFVSTHLPTAPEHRVEAVIREAAERGDDVCLSGGEPTLDPRLVEWVRLAKAAGSPLVELQTNAVRIDDAMAEALREAGVDLAHVSLHGAHAEVSDAITGAPGTFDKTVRGIDALVAAGHRLRLNFVFCELNLAEFPSYVTMVADRWPEAEVCVSFVAASTDVVPRTRALIPRYGDVIPQLREGIRMAEERGLHLSGFESMCGIPLCLVPDDLTRFFTVADVPDAYRGDEVVHPEPCESCALRPKCFGVRRGYVALHGIGELRPLRR